MPRKPPKRPPAEDLAEIKQRAADAIAGRQPSYSREESVARARAAVDLVAELRDALAEARLLLKRGGEVTPAAWDQLIGPEPRCPFCGALAVRSEPTGFAVSVQRSCSRGHDWVTL
jgi:hypothetical protein